MSLKSTEAAWYYIQENSEGNPTTIKDAAIKFNLTTSPVSKALRRIRDELGVKGEFFFKLENIR